MNATSKPHDVPIARQSARGILFDENDQIVLIKRTKSGQAPYWTTPGGGIELIDSSYEAALRRELLEELGATISKATHVFLVSSPAGSGIAIQHFFVARLATMDISLRHGQEFDDPSRGSYDIDRIDPRAHELALIDLRPIELKEFILANQIALLNEIEPNSHT